MKKWLGIGTALLLGALAVSWISWAQEIRPPRFEFGGRGFRDGGSNVNREAAMASRLRALLDDDRVKAALGLTDEQSDRLRKILVETEKSTVKTRADMAVRGIELRELLRADKPDREAVMKKADEISSLRGEMMNQHIEALLDAKSVLTPDQQKKIRTFIERRAQRGEGIRPFGGGWPRGPGGEGPNPPAPPPAPRGSDGPTD